MPPLAILQHIEFYFISVSVFTDTSSTLPFSSLSVGSVIFHSLKSNLSAGFNSSLILVLENANVSATHREAAYFHNVGDLDFPLKRYIETSCWAGAYLIHLY
ncbi:hypothetical protein ALT785_660015 [Alteromonas infernus]